MSNPDPSHDPENVMDDDPFDYQQQLDEEMQRQEEEQINGEFEGKHPSSNPRISRAEPNSWISVATDGVPGKVSGQDESEANMGSAMSPHQLEARGLNWQAYWLKREKDRKDERAFWDKFWGTNKKETT